MWYIIDVCEVLAEGALFSEVKPLYSVGTMMGAIKGLKKAEKIRQAHLESIPPKRRHEFHLRIRVVNIKDYPWTKLDQ